MQLQVFWLPFHPTCPAFPAPPAEDPVACLGFRPRLQRRVRYGFYRIPYAQLLSFNSNNKAQKQ